MAERDQKKKSEAKPAEPPAAPQPMEIVRPATPVTADFLERARRLSRRIQEPQLPAAPAPERMAEPVPAPPEVTLPSRPAIPQTFEQPEEEFVRPPAPTGHFFLADVLLPELGRKTLGESYLVSSARGFGGRRMDPPWGGWGVATVTPCLQMMKAIEDWESVSIDVRSEASDTACRLLKAEAARIRERVIRELGALAFAVFVPGEPSKGEVYEKELKEQSCIYQQIRRAAASGDPEVRARAEEVLKECGEEP